jgi:peptidoglycan/xylan/chitin deacetylase (PgdA/CDA1 family)
MRLSETGVDKRIADQPILYLPVPRWKEFLEATRLLTIAALNHDRALVLTSTFAKQPRAAAPETFDVGFSLLAAVYSHRQCDDWSIARSQRVCYHLLRSTVAASGADLKNLLKAGIGRVASMTGVFNASSASKMRIVAFHRVNDRLPPDSLTCTSKMFEEFCRYFKTHFKVVPLSEQIQACHEKRSMGGTLSITFDDGYLDNYEVAAPILERLGLPATFFITSSFVGSRQVPFWDKDLPFQPGWMSWEHVRDLSARGFHIGGHTETHIDMGRADLPAIRAELTRSKQQVEGELGKDVNLFAYPFGGLDNITEASRQLVRETGFRCCMGCYSGSNPATPDPYYLKRIPISTWFSSPHQLGGELFLERSAS